MKKVVMTFFLIQCYAMTFSSDDNLLFENYWEQSKEQFKMYFAVLSEIKDLTISQEDSVKHLNFFERCMQGLNSSVLFHSQGKKIVYHCSKDQQKLIDFINEDKAKYKESFSTFAEFMKAGNTAFLKNPAKSGGFCSMKADVCPEWDSKDPVLLGYALKKLPEKGQNGIYSVQGCDVKLLYYS